MCIDSSFEGQVDLSLIYLHKNGESAATDARIGPGKRDRMKLRPENTEIEGRIAVQGKFSLLCTWQMRKTWKYWGLEHVGIC